MCEKMGKFARAHILPCHDLGKETDFPWEIWSAMGDQGLLNPEHLAKTSPCLSITQTARSMVEKGGNLGLALSWMIHQMTASYLVRPNLACLVDKGFWDRVKIGDATVSFAVSEPKAGAHPKYMAARAEKYEAHYFLSGEKAYLTNGPIAACFVVIAVTGTDLDNGEKSFSAFLVPKDIPGLVVGGPMDIPFFKPSPHGNIQLDGCRLGMDRLLGVEGRAFPDLVLPFRKLEDAAMTGAVTGAMLFVLSRAAGRLAGRFKISPGQVEDLGALGAMTETAVYLSDRIAVMTDQEDGVPEALVLSFRQTAARFLEDLETLLSETHIGLEGQAAVLAKDLASSAGIGSTVAGIKKQKIGRRLLDQNAGF